MLFGGRRHIILKLLRHNFLWKSVKDSLCLQLCVYLILLALLTPILPEFSITLLSFGQQGFEIGLFLFIKLLLVRLVLYITVKVASFGRIDIWLLPNLLNTRLGRKPYLPWLQVMFVTQGCSNDVMTWPKVNPPIFHTQSQSSYEIDY